ncbi:MAG: HEAT repeat domain-containing protein, partial [Planctomycetota bacterium]
KERDHASQLLQKFKQKNITEENKKKILGELANIKPECKVKPFIDTLVNSSHQEAKLYATSELGQITDPRSAYPLVNTTLYDKSLKIRTEALNSLKQLKPARAENFFIRNLDNESPLIRSRAVAGIQQVGSPKAAGVLIKKLIMTYTGFGRGHIYIGDQFSYIKDYDIIIAVPPSAMVDPIVATVNEGIVLDVDVIRVDVEITIETERTVIGRALNQLTGQDFGPDANKWAAWWNENKKVILAQ